MIEMLLNHLWQSSLCVCGAGLAALALHRNGANVRFWVWFAASVKFLVPFAALTAFSAHVLTPIMPPVAVPTVTLAAPLAKPFSTPSLTRIAASFSEPSTLPAMGSAQTVAPAPAARPTHAAPTNSTALRLDLELALLALWAAGFLMLATRWLTRWRKVRALLEDAVEIHVGTPVAVKLSPSRLEPGLVGILNPVILLPQGIERQLSPAELRAVLGHEICHWRRQDNLLAAIHMLVEAIFWFFPLVWWLGARLNAERERACDESVLADGNDPRMYAEGILKVCRAYLQSPLACVAGVSGSVLKNRIEAIMDNRLILQLNAVPKFVLSASAAAALALPLALGLMAAPVAQGEAKAAPMPSPAKNPERSNARSDAAPPIATQASADLVLPARPQTIAAPVPQARVAEISAQAPLHADADAVAAAIAPPPPAAQPPTVPIAASSVQTAMAANAAPQSQPAQAAETCPLPQIADTAELKPVAGTSLMTVPVMINGKPKQFLLDISANPSEVSQATVAELGLPLNARGSSAIQSAGTGFSNGMSGAFLGQMQLPVYDVKGNQDAYSMRARVRAATFTIGGATARNMQFMIANDSEIDKTAPYDGRLTTDIFRQYDVEVDFAAKQINYLTPNKCTNPDQVVFWSHFEVGVVPMSLQGGRIQIPVTIEGHAINAVIDTSSERSVMRRDIAELTLGYKAGTPGTMPSGELKDGMDEIVYVHTFPQIGFAGGVTAVNVPVLIQTNSMLRNSDERKVLGSNARTAEARIPDLTIGMDVLRHLHPYFVFSQGKLYVTAVQ
jgi:beta-lactamase regulating signal transducer with metallopeptidase domain